MSEANLGFKVYEKDYGDGYPVWYVEQASGVRRRASHEEVTLWKALHRAMAEAAEARAPKPGKSRA